MLAVLVERLYRKRVNIPQYGSAFNEREMNNRYYIVRF